MPFLIPTRKDVPDYTQSQVLEGVEYNFRFLWNMRGGWFMSISDASEEPLLGLTRMVAGINFTDLVRWDPRCPAGDLVLADLQGGFVDPGYYDLASGPVDNLQGRVGLVYIPSDDPFREG